MCRNRSIERFGSLCTSGETPTRRARVCPCRGAALQGASAGAYGTPSGSVGLRVNFPGALPPATTWPPFRAGRAGLGTQEVIRHPAHPPPVSSPRCGTGSPQRGEGSEFLHFLLEMAVDGVSYAGGKIATPALSLCKYHDARQCGSGAAWGEGACANVARPDLRFRVRMARTRCSGGRMGYGLAVRGRPKLPYPPLVLAGGRGPCKNHMVSTREGTWPVSVYRQLEFLSPISV